MIKVKNPKLIAIVCAILILLLLAAFGASYAAASATKSTLNIINDILFLVMSIVSAIIGALIITRQPANTIGWILGAFPVSYMLTLPIGQLQPQPGADLSQISTLSWLALWFSGWNWWLILAPFLLIALFFPTGRLLSPRWRWVVAALLVEIAIFIFISTFTTTFNLSDTVTIQNPIGWISEEVTNLLLIPYQIVLVAIAASSVAAIIVRYRRAVGIVREQIKWLFYAYGIFLSIMASGLVFSDTAWFGIVLDISFLSIPLAIGVSILRYRLWDIDILIRRTISYAFLTLFLGLSYFGSVILLQGIFERLFAGNSQVVIVFSTLLIAALFNPLRLRIQSAIDRRFYRQKYDAAQALEEFSTAASQQVELDQLTENLTRVIHQTVQPEQLLVWIKTVKNN